MQQPPAKFIFAQEGRRMGVALDSIVCAGCIISGGRVVRSILSPGVRVNSYCEVESSILMPKVHIGRYSRLQRTIVDAGVSVPDTGAIVHTIGSPVLCRSTTSGKRKARCAGFGVPFR